MIDALYFRLPDLRGLDLKTALITVGGALVGYVLCYSFWRLIRTIARKISRRIGGGE